MTVAKKVILFDEALEISGFGIYNFGLLWLCGLILVGMVFETLGLSFIIPAAQCDLKLTLSQKGWLGALPFAAIIVTSHMWGYLADTKGRKPVMMISMFLGTFFSVFSSLCPNLWSFALMRFITGIFASGSSAVIYAYLGEFNNAVYRDKMVAFGASFLSVGTGCMAALAWGILRLDFNQNLEALGIEFKPWRLLIILYAMPYFISSLIMLKAPESPRFLVATGKADETLAVLAKIYQSNKRTTHNPFEGMTLDVVIDESDKKVTFISILRSLWNQTVPLFQRPLLMTTCIACFAQFSVLASSNGFYLWLPEILNKLSADLGEGVADMNICGYIKYKPLEPITDSNDTIVAAIHVCHDYVSTGTFLNSIYISIMLFVTLITASILVNIVGKKAILIAIPMVSGVSAVILHWITQKTASLVLFALIQVCGGSIGIMNAVIVEMYPTHLRAMAVCLSMMFGRAGSILGANLVGYLMSIYCPSSFFVFGGLLIISALVCALIPSSVKTV